MEIVTRSACSIGGALMLLSACGNQSAVTPVTGPSIAMAQRIAHKLGYRVLYRFAGGSDGARPDAALTNVSGTLYGTTSGGGSHGEGTVYSISVTGAEKVLYSFAGGADGSNPRASLIDVNGTLYGTTVTGGASNYGTVFSVSPNGLEKVLHSFSGGEDGTNPHAALLDVNGKLYGTTTGASSTRGTYGDGTVFSITTSGHERVMHNFTGPPDGANPYGTLVDVNGTLYGTTYNGGANGTGAVYSIGPGNRETVIYSFGSLQDAQQPIAGLFALNGVLYGTTQSSANGDGAVYSVTTEGVESVLHVFSATGTDGFQLWAPLIGVNNALYGTTLYGGSVDDGTVYRITTNGKERVLHSFFQGPRGGAFTIAGLVNVNGMLYGVTDEGGDATNCEFGCGIVFSMRPSQ